MAIDFDKQEENVSILSSLVVVLLLTAFLALLALYNGWAVMVLWNWFAVPLGVAAITLGQAIGIDLLISFLTFKTTYTSVRDMSTEEKVKYYALIFLNPIIIVGMGWLVTIFLL